MDSRTIARQGGGGGQGQAMVGSEWALCVLVLLGVLPPSFVAHAGQGPGAPVPSSSPYAVHFVGRGATTGAKTMRLKGGAGDERTRETEARSRQKTQEMEVDAEHEVEAAVKRRAQVCPPRTVGHASGVQGSAPGQAPGVQRMLSVPSFHFVPPSRGLGFEV